MNPIFCPPPSGCSITLPASCFDRVVVSKRFFERGIQRLIQCYGDAYLRFADEHAAFIFHRGSDHAAEMEKSVKAYTKYSMEYLYLQYQLEASDEARYQCASFEDGRREVYDNRK